MFLRSVKASNGRHEYLRLVENYREGEKIRQRVVLHVGRKDLLAPHLDALVRLLQTDQQNPTWVSTEEVSTPQARTWGPVLVARHLFGRSRVNRFTALPVTAALPGFPVNSR